MKKIYKILITIAVILYLVFVPQWIGEYIKQFTCNPRWICAPAYVLGIVCHVAVMGSIFIVGIVVSVWRDWFND